VFVFFIKSLVLEALFTGVSITVINAASFIKVNVGFVACLSTAITGNTVFIVGETGASTILGVRETSAFTTGCLADTIVTTTIVSAGLGRTKGVVIASSILATASWFSAYVAKPLVSSLVPVAVEVDSLVGKTKVEVFRINHSSSERIVRSSTEVGNINSISEVEVLGTTIGVSGDKVNIGVRLNNPDELLNRVVKVKLNLVTSGVDRLSTSELKLLNKIFV
jgi:hypothetical protein